MTRAKRTTVSAVLFSTALLVGLEASARIETLRWSHENPAAVDGYHVHYGIESEVYAWQIDVGTPDTDADGNFVYDLDVPDTATVYVAVTAYAGTLESDFSNERMRSPSEDPGSGGGEDPGTSPQANAAIDHFVLWNAETDAVIDSDFTSGEQIVVSEHGCTAIEVIGNDYLAQFGSPGSIQFDFDGETQSTCSNAGYTHENEPPYAWEAETGPDQFECASTLTQVGSHDLKVTPYDGNDCSGSVGPSVTLSFDVTDTASSGGSSPEPGPPGKPGQPTLVTN